MSATALVRCVSCERLSSVADLDPGVDARCGRCGSVLRRRKRDSLARTWAFLIAAAICYVPANVFPVMVVAGPGGSEADTILSGVMAMFAVGWYAVGALIFFASITVPVLKILILFGLLVPENCNNEHLQILARVAQMFNDEALRDRLRAQTDPEKLRETLLNWHA